LYKEGKPEARGADTRRPPHADGRPAARWHVRQQATGAQCCSTGKGDWWRAGCFVWRPKP